MSEKKSILSSDKGPSNWLPLKKHSFATLKLALPMCSTQLFMFSTIFIDTLIIGRYGIEENSALPLAGLALGGAFFSWFYSSAIGLFGALNPMIAQSFGKNNIKAIGPMVSQSLVVAFVCSLAVLAIFQFSYPIFRFLGQSAGPASVAADYLGYLSLGIPASFFFMVTKQISDATSDPKSALIAVSIGTIANIFLDLGLVLGNFGMPRLGVAGAAIATTAVNWGILMIHLLILIKKSHYRSLQLRPRRRHWEHPYFRELFSIGGPASLSLVCEISLFAGAVFIMGAISELALASHQVAINIVALFFMIPLGLSFAACTRVGQAAGANDFLGVRWAGISAILITVVLQSFFAVFLIIFPDSIAGWYTQDPLLQGKIAQLIYIAALFQMFDGLQVVGIGILRGVKDTRIPLACNFVSYWIIGFPAALILGLYTPWGAKGVWIGILLGLAAASVAHITRFFIVYGKDRAPIS